MSAIIRFLKQHDIVAAYPAKDGQNITVASLVVDRSNRVSIEVKTIAPTMQAARDWLQY